MKRDHGIGALDNLMVLKRVPLSDGCDFIDDRPKVVFTSTDAGNIDSRMDRGNRTT
jgi:hypothetical protein